MPSYRYTKDIKPEDLSQEPPRELTKKEKRANWWHYNWYWVVGAVAAIGITAFFVKDLIFKTLPDYTIGIISTAPFPDPLVEQIEKALSDSVDDRNGDGQRVVKVETFILNPAEDDVSSSHTNTSAPAADPYTQMAGVVRLTTAIGSGEPAIFLCSPDSAEIFQRQYGIFGSFDGRIVQDSNLRDITVKWEDSKLLSSLDLNVDLYNYGNIDGQKEMAQYLVGIRPYYDTALESKKNGKELWDSQNILMERITEEKTSAS